MKGCYTNKLYSAFDTKHAMSDIDVRNTQWFLKSSPIDFRKEFQKLPLFMRFQKRFRYATRGETITKEKDLNKVIEIAKLNPDVQFMLPTRAWRKGRTKRQFDALLATLTGKAVINKYRHYMGSKNTDPMKEHSGIGRLASKLVEASKLKNLKILCSIDESTSEKEVDSLTKLGLSTMYFGDDSKTEGRFLCPKTHNKGEDITCVNCVGGCFSDVQIHVHLKKH